MKVHPSQVDNMDGEPTRVTIHKKREKHPLHVHPKGLTKAQKQKLQDCRKVRPTESRLQ